MYPVLYRADETDFTHNGLGILRDSTSVIALEESNGIFELHLEYDQDGPFANIIDYEMIIKAKVNDKQEPQLFRIYAINKSLENDNIVIDAQHITYDLAGNFVESLELDNATAAEAMSAIQNNLAYPTKFTISSDNTVTRSSTKLYRTNPLQMIAGMDGSILDNWGGEIERDNFRLILHARRGSDDGVLVAYKKNLTGLEAKFDVSNVVTRIFPFKVLEDGTVITIPGKYIDSPLIDNYSFIRILPIDASDDEEVTDSSSLYDKYKDYFNSGDHDKPTISMEVEFEPLWATEEYKDVAALEFVGMGDTITVHHKKMNVDVTAKVVRVEYDVIAEKNAKVTVGSVQSGLTDRVNQVSSDTDNGINQALQAANTAIVAANGKNTIFYGPDEPTGAKKDDLWFKVVDGEYTRTYRFDGVQWQLIMDMDVNLTKQDAEQAKQDAQTAVDAANQATQDAQTAIDQAQQGFDAAQDALSKATSAENTANSAINTANNASQVAGDATAQAQSALTQAQNAMAEAQKKADATSVYTKTEIDAALQGYATTATVNVLTGRVDSAETAIQQNANAIQLKADQSTVDTLTGRVSTAEATLAAQADQIAARITKADADAKYATQTALTATANSLTSSITAVQTDLNNLQIGGRNLVRDSMTFENLNPDSIVARGGVVVQNYVGNFSAVKCDVTWNGISFSANALYNRGKLLLGKTYTYSVTIKNETDIEIRISSYYIGIDSNGNRWDPIRNKDLGRLKPGEVKTLFDTIEITQDVITAIGYGPLNFTIQGANISSKSSGSLYFYMPKFELGNRATDWTPAPEDMATVVQFNTLSQTLDSTVSRIGNAEGNISALQQTASSLGTRITDAEGDISTLTQTVDGLQTTVSNVQGDVTSVTQLANTLQTRLTNAEGNINTLTQTANSLTSQISSKADQSWVSSQISQLSNDINLRVEKDDIINQINISTEGVLIDGKKVHITGQTLIDNAVITSAMIKSVDAGKITTGTLDAAKVSVINLNASNIKSGSFAGKTFTGGTFVGAKFMSDTGSGFMSLTTHGIEFDDGTNTFSLSRTKVETNAVATNVANLYLAPKDGQEVRVVRYDDIPGDGQVSSYHYLNLRAWDIQIMGSGIRADSGSNLYLMAESSSGKEVWCTNKLGYNGGNTGFIPIRVQGVRTGYTNLYLQANEIRAVSSGPDTWGDTSTPTYAGLRSSTIIIEHASEGPLLTFNMERGWQFRQNDTGQSASLALRALVGEKEFVIEGPDGSNALLVHTQNGGPGYVRVYGDFSVNGTKSALVDTVTYGKRLMYAIEAPDNRFMDVIEQILSPGEHWVELNPMFAETINGYSVFPIPQSGGSATILEREPTRFKVNIESDMAIPIAFWIYGKRIGYENEYMKEVVDAA